MDRLGLLAHLDFHVQDPQPAERWVMYRLITPVVDYATVGMSVTLYFEFNQTSEHRTHQSVDIALLDNQNTPQVLVEAKRVNRKLSPEQIAKYLEPGVRGIVTDGYIWILCEGERHSTIRLFFDGQLVEETLDQIVAFITGKPFTAEKVNSVSDEYSSTEKVHKVEKLHRAKRAKHTVQSTKNAEDFQAFIDTLDKSPAAEIALLSSIYKALQKLRTTPNFHWETRVTRVSFFDDSLPKKQQRLARIELGKKQPDILIRNEIVNKNLELAKIATPTIHDKGKHMRRFRIGSEADSKAFGTELIHALSVER